jgi:hypothetical protein
MWAVVSFPIEPEPAGVAPGGTGKSDGQCGGNCPSRDTETEPSGVLRVNDRWGVVVVLEDPARVDDEQPTSERQAKATTAAGRTHEGRKS